MTRMIKNAPDIRAINECVLMDGTTFSSDDRPEDTVLALDEFGRILGIVNAIFGLDAGSRCVWTALPVVGPINSFLVGLAIRRGLLAKDGLLKLYGIRGSSPCHGKPREILHDRGSEFIAKHVKRVIKDMRILIDESSPPYDPTKRAKGERFNRTAHQCFADFLDSPGSRKYL